MRPESYLAKILSLPELKLTHVRANKNFNWLNLEYESVSTHRACQRCGNLSQVVYDQRVVKIQDAPIRDQKVSLQIRKKRYFCKTCRKPFTELLYGIFKGSRLTERFRRHILWCCDKFQNLKAVSRALGCSNTTIRRSYYSHLKIHVGRHLNYGFPKKLGIDEHFFGMSSSQGNEPIQSQKYHTTLVDLKAHRLYRSLKEKDQKSIFDQLKNESGFDQVEDVVMDMSEGFRNVALALFPKARITADKFHVLKLLVRPLNKERKKVIGHKKKKNTMSSLLLKSAHDLEYSVRRDIQFFLYPHDKLRMIYHFKERLHALYRCRGRKCAEKSMAKILKDLQKYDHIEALKTLRKTLINWKEEILNHFTSRLTNAMTEGFNNKIKLIKRMAYGFKNPDLYNLRILYDCYH